MREFLTRARESGVNHPALQLLKARSGTSVVRIPCQGIATGIV